MKTTSLNENPISLSLNFTTPKPTTHMIYSAYDRPKHKVSITFAPGTGRTKQSFKDDSDINNIMRKFQKTGTLEFTNKVAPRYADLEGVDFQEAMLVVARGNSMFHELPSSLRARFDNDPGKFLLWMEDPNTVEEQRELGLRLPKEDAGTPLPATPAGAAGRAPAASEEARPLRDAETGRYETKADHASERAAAPKKPIDHT